jgi:hypothetical protein
MFHFVKASLSPSFILHRLALAHVSFCKNFPGAFSHSAQVRLGQCFHFMKVSLSPSLILHRFTLANVSFYENFLGKFSHSTPVRFGQCFIL